MAIESIVVASDGNEKPPRFTCSDLQSESAAPCASLMLALSNRITPFKTSSAAPLLGRLNSRCSLMLRTPLAIAMPRRLGR